MDSRSGREIRRAGLVFAALGALLTFSLQTPAPAAEPEAAQEPQKKDAANYDYTAHVVGTYVAYRF